MYLAYIFFKNVNDYFTVKKNTLYGCMHIVYKNNTIGGTADGRISLHKTFKSYIKYVIKFTYCTDCKYMIFK